MNNKNSKELNGSIVNLQAVVEDGFKRLEGRLSELEEKTNTDHAKLEKK